MKSGFPTEDMIRRYLLGRLDRQDELEDSLSRQMLLDDELSEIVDSIEDQIVEDYLDGALSVEDRKAVEEHFLRPPQRKEKLEFARFLRRQLAASPAPLAEPVDAVVASTTPPGQVDGSLVGHFRYYSRTYWEVAALSVLMVSSLLYFNHLRGSYQDQIESNQRMQKQLERQLDHERALTADLAKEVDGLQPPLAFSWAVFRGPSASPQLVPQIDLTPLTQRIQVEIREVPAGIYDVRLESAAGKQIWAQSITAPSFGALRLEIPMQDITTDDYRLLISSHPEKSYWFHAHVMK